MYHNPEELRNFWNYFNSSWKFKIIAIIAIVFVILFNFKLKSFINKGKQTLSYVYLLIVVLNLLYYWFSRNNNQIIEKDVKDVAKNVDNIFDKVIKNEDNVRENRNVSALKKKIVASNQQWKCGICHQLLDETYEVDHIIPLYQGGTNDISNLMALDPICHKKKTFRQQYLN